MKILNHSSFRTDICGTPLDTTFCFDSTESQYLFVQYESLSNCTCNSQYFDVDEFSLICSDNMMCGSVAYTTYCVMVHDNKTFFSLITD